MEENYRIPLYLDAPPMFLLWEADEAYAFFIPLLAAFSMSSNPFLALAAGGGVGLACMQAMAHVKANGGKQLFRQAAYWFLPSHHIYRFRRTPESHVREFIG
ncbi:MAG TPA: type IV conjugative transfer system protein TraL [Thiotrichales bacterium]|nr:type IV conjugative transfer system protein TraL [Thiotrichales bacterium]